MWLHTSLSLIDVGHCLDTSSILCLTPMQAGCSQQGSKLGGSTVFLGLEGAIGSGSVRALTPNLREEMEAAWPEMLSCGLNTAAAWSVPLWSWPGTLTPGWHTWWLLLSGSLGLSKKGWEGKVLNLFLVLLLIVIWDFLKNTSSCIWWWKNAFSISVGSQPSLVPPVEVSEGFCVPSNVESAGTAVCWVLANSACSCIALWQWLVGWDLAARLLLSMWLQQEPLGAGPRACGPLGTERIALMLLWLGLRRGNLGTWVLQMPVMK